MLFRGIPVDLIGGSSNQFRKDVLRLYDLAVYIRKKESSLSLLKSGSDEANSAAADLLGRFGGGYELCVSESKSNTQVGINSIRLCDRHFRYADGSC